MSDPIVLPARLDVAVVDDLARALRPAIVDGDVRLDASEVTHLGALGLQVILSAARSAASHGHRLHIDRPSDRFSTHLATMGLNENAFVEGTV